MKRGKRFVLPCMALASSVALAIAPPTVFADDGGELPVFTLLSGTYRYVGTPEKDHAKIQKSIEAAITSLGSNTSSSMSQRRRATRRIEFSES